MDDVVVELRRDQVAAIVEVDQGALVIDASRVAELLSTELDMSDIRAAVSDVDFELLDDGQLDIDKFSALGIWWWTIGEDTAIVGAFSIDGYSLSATVEGAGESPIADDNEVLRQAAEVMAAQYPGSEYVEPGLFRMPTVSGDKLVRVVVTRDRRVTRVPDMLDQGDFSEFINGQMGVVVVKGIGIRDSTVEEHFLWPSSPSWRVSNGPS